MSEVIQQESLRTKHQHNGAETYEASKVRFLHMVNTAKSRGTNVTWKANMAMILDPNNHPDQYNSQLQRHVMNERADPIITDGEEIEGLSAQLEMFTEDPEDKRDDANQSFNPSLLIGQM